MAKSKPATVKEYLAYLPAERRKVVSELRKLIRRHLPTGYQQAISWGVLSYEVPVKRYPDTYNGKLLSYICLASQKNYYAYT
jgi:hypothetical protein